MSTENAKIQKATDSVIKMLESGNEICLISFDETGKYDVFVYFSDENVINTFYDVISNMKKEILNLVNLPTNPNHWSYKEGNV